jgi:hypothetical protein
MDLHSTKALQACCGDLLSLAQRAIALPPGAHKRGDRWVSSRADDIPGSPLAATRASAKTGSARA